MTNTLLVLNEAVADPCVAAKTWPLSGLLSIRVVGQGEYISILYTVSYWLMCADSLACKKGKGKAAGQYEPWWAEHTFRRFLQHCRPHSLNLKVHFWCFWDSVGFHSSRFLRQVIRDEGWVFIIQQLINCGWTEAFHTGFLLNKLIFYPISGSLVKFRWMLYLVII